MMLDTSIIHAAIRNPCDGWVTKAPAITAPMIWARR